MSMEEWRDARRLIRMLDNASEEERKRIFRDLYIQHGISCEDWLKWRLEAHLQGESLQKKNSGKEKAR